MMRFLIEEHVTKRIQRAVWHDRATLDLLRVGDMGAPSFETSDAELLVFAEQTGRMFVTNDKASLRGPGGHIAAHRAAGRHTWGVAFVRPGAPLAAIAATIVLLAEASTPDEWRDQELWIPF